MFYTSLNKLYKKMLKNRKRKKEIFNSIQNKIVIENS